MDPEPVAAHPVNAGVLPNEDVPLDVHPTNHWHVVSDGSVGLIVSHAGYACWLGDIDGLS